MLLFKELENCLFLLLAMELMVLRTLKETVTENSVSFKNKLCLLNTKAVVQEKHQMQIKKTVKTLSKKIQRLKKS